MLPVTILLNKVIVARFYERNAGFFFFVFYMMFGIVESSQIVTYHLSLIYGMMESFMFHLLIFGIWLLYMGKCLQFVLGQTDKPENSILYQISLLDSNKQSRVLFGTISMVNLPVLTYSIVIIGVAGKSAHYLFVAEVILYHLILIALATMVFKHKLNTPHKSSHFIQFPTIRWNRPKPFIIFYLQQLTHQLPSVLFFAKCFSVMALYGFLQITLDHYEVRVALLGLLFSLAAHSVIVFELRKFEDRFLEFSRTLPISSISRFMTYAAIYAILLIPEAILLMIHHIHLIDVVPVLLFGSGFLLYLHCALYKDVLNMDKHTQKILFLFLVSFMIVLCKIYLIELLFLWGYSFFLFTRNYYRYEGLKGQTI